MHIEYRLKPKHLLLLLVSGTLLFACGDHECGPACHRPEPTVENLWPNQDGTFWTYDYTWRAWDSEVNYYADEDSLPPLPSMDEIENLLRNHPIGDNPDTVTGVYKLEFSGQTTTGSGVTAQNLEQTVIPTRGCGLLTRADTPHPGFLERLRLVRPDLRPGIDAHLPALVPSSLGHLVRGDAYGKERDPSHTLRLTDPPSPGLIHGGAWEKTHEWIGTYGDLDTLLAWKFLEADLASNHEFTHQLVPSLADDVFLHCRVLGKTVLRTSAGDFWKALECIYLVDYGPANIDPPGGTERWQHFYDYGRVVYVPDLGPVHSYERVLIAVGKTVGAVYGDITVELAGTNLLTD